MKDDYTTNSHYITYALSLENVRRMHLFQSEMVKS